MQEILEVNINSIVPNPWQPRRAFSNEELQGLADSIKMYGILQPLVVTEHSDGHYRLIAGERRFRAAKLAGLKQVPAIIREATNEEQLELALVENIQRQDLNAIERARAYRRLITEFKLTQEKVAQRLGKARSAVANTLRLLDLSEEMQGAVASGRITEGHAKVIVGLPAVLQKKFFDKVVQHGLSVRETEHLAREQRQRLKTAGVFQAAPKSDNLSDHYRSLLESHLGTKVDVDGRETGSLTVHFFSEEELARVVKKILGKEN